MFSEEPSTRMYGVIARKHTTRTLAVVYLKSQQSYEYHTGVYSREQQWFWVRSWAGRPGLKIFMTNNDAFQLKTY
jgi:hypothetical protein